MRLNPRFDGAFLNYKLTEKYIEHFGLNPRFDGAFLNWKTLNKHHGRMGP